MSEVERWLRAYAEDRNEDAFRRLVDRYYPMVYSAAVRQVGDPHAAEDISQQVFTHLAQRARTLPANVVVGGWLYRDSLFTASKYRRSMARRRVREEAAAKMRELNFTNDEVAWEQVSPLLEEGMRRLGDTDRDAVVLRFFEGQTFRSVGTALGTTEDAARRRVERALEKLRQFLASRGVAASATGLAALLAANSIGSVPSGNAMATAAQALNHACVHAHPTSFPGWFTTQSLMLALIGVLLVGLLPVLFWPAPSGARRVTVRNASPPAETRAVQIKGSIRRTTANPQSMAYFSFKIMDGPAGVEVAATNLSSNYRLVARTTLEGGRASVESALFENAFDPTSPSIRFPPVTVTNAERAVVSNGIFSFEFTTTFRPLLP